MKIIWGFLGLILLAVTLGLFFGLNKMGGDGMEPAIKNGTSVITRKYFLNKPYPQRGDIIMYRKSAEAYADYVGRVIALPGESVRFNNGNLYIKDNIKQYKIEESYLPQDTKTYDNTADGNSSGWTDIGQFSYFVLLDKRKNRVDIKEHLVNRDNIISVVIAILK